MRAGVRLSLVFALPAALCFGLAGVACTDGTTPSCSGDAGCNEALPDGTVIAPADTGSSSDTGGGQDTSSEAETGTGAEGGAETGADADAAQHDAADADSGHPKDAHGQ